ncbi:hypothetical protein [Mycobacterium paraintracellulare]|uniref:hypothetical protein n=1 Tax=Mycobacterium paraintracellulare TaxID=1138383 RepID=UPI00138ABA8D|nr:hypothetical protein [Mycobacterium paraintracellulare]
MRGAAGGGFGVVNGASMGQKPLRDVGQPGRAYGDLQASTPYWSASSILLS